MFQKLQGILQSQIPVNFPRCPALVKRIKMNAVHIGIQQFGALAGGVLDAYLLNSVRIGTRTLQRLKQPGRKTGASGKLPCGSCRTGWSQA